MNITRENIDEVNAVIKVLIEKADYEKTVEDTLKEYRKKASIPGFRPGKVPAGLIKKRFGKAILAEEVNKMLSQNLSKYLVEEKLNILGNRFQIRNSKKISTGIKMKILNLLSILLWLPKSIHWIKT